jgi:3-oxoadipate enol-lactonase
MPIADVAGRPFEYIRRGSGEPLLLITGLSGTHASWGEPFLELLEPSVDVIAYDHRGIGGSVPIDGSFTIADLADDAAGLLDALGIDSAHVLGISMGGMIAQELVLARPELVRTLSLGCTYPGGPDAQLTAPSVIQRLMAGFSTGDSEAILRASFEANVSPAYAARPGSWETFRAAALAVPAPIPVVFEQLRATATHDTADRLPSITTPTLVIHGDQDEILNVANGRLIARLIPGAQLEILPGVGHLFWLEEPARSAELVLAHARSPAAAQ